MHSTNRTLFRALIACLFLLCTGTQAAPLMQNTEDALEGGEVRLRLNGNGIGTAYVIFDNATS